MKFTPTVPQSDKSAWPNTALQGNQKLKDM